jgi:hypothetical protein
MDLSVSRVFYLLILYTLRLKDLGGPELDEEMMMILIVDIEYKLKIVFVVWFGTHEEYDETDAKTVNYDN